MILTEEEAKTKNCPENPWLGPNERAVLCLGSACMAWRWVEGERSQGMFQGVSPPTKGYCGKAGKP